MSEFKIRTLIREVISRSSTPDRYVIAKEVLTEIPAAELEGVLAEMLPHEVGRVQSQMRDSFDKDRISRLWNMSPFERATAKAARSNKKEPWIDVVQHFLAASAPFDINKYVKDMNKADCLRVASGYKLHAENNAAKGETWARLANQLNENQTLSQIPAEEVAQVLATPPGAIEE